MEEGYSDTFGHPRLLKIKLDKIWSEDDNDDDEISALSDLLVTDVSWLGARHYDAKFFFNVKAEKLQWEKHFEGSKSRHY